MMAESDATVEATRRLNVKKQTLDDAYAAPANFLEIDVTNLPVFKVKESSVRRRYSDFEWLRNELERDSKIVVPPLPGKAWKRQLPFRGHPLAQNERCLHMFLQEPQIDKNYVPGKIRNT
ncbi:hypothetical protein NQ314_013390 [Rhamnusium bicolor]|uniref:Sorting nexin-3 n=1 Tax=Rhamnusium bicolor TaxID=1586634 RepID=A0AAV8X8P4_9CUCU|nr:hypothetical protein NQ314_013390 [Rhamnusium bicolor]